jgi:hypothetical protein
MHISEELAQENLKSWDYLTEFYERLLASEGWDYVMPLVRLVEHLKQSEYAKYFRAGQSLWHLMISTASQYGLAEDDLYIYVTIKVEKTIKNNKPVYFTDGIEVSYKQGIQKIERITCDEPELVFTIEPLLKRLWNETRGTTGNYYE